MEHFQTMPPGTTTWPQVVMYFLMTMTAAGAIPMFLTYVKTLAIARQQKANTEKLDANTTLTAVVHDKVNGKMEQLIAAKVEEALAKGREEGARQAQVNAANVAIGKLEGIQQAESK